MDLYLFSFFFIIWVIGIVYLGHKIWNAKKELRDYLKNKD